MDKILSIFATLFGVGLFPKAPGTAGSFVALILGSVLVHYIGWQVFLLIIILLFFLGWLAANAFERLKGEHNSPKIVIDKLVGMWIVLFPVEAFGPLLGDFRYDGLAAFILFRIFDIWKPWPVSLADNKIKGGLGVMLDDVIAGVMAGIVLIGIGYIV